MFTTFVQIKGGIKTLGNRENTIKNNQTYSVYKSTEKI